MVTNYLPAVICKSTTWSGVKNSRHVDTPIIIYIYIHRVYVYVYVYVCVCVYVYVYYTYMHMNPYVYDCVCVYIYICLYICTSMYVCTLMWIHYPSWGYLVTTAMAVKPWDQHWPRFARCKAYQIGEDSADNAALARHLGLMLRISRKKHQKLGWNWPKG